MYTTWVRRLGEMLNPQTPKLKAIQTCTTGLPHRLSVWGFLAHFLGLPATVHAMWRSIVSSLLGLASVLGLLCGSSKEGRVLSGPDKGVQGLQRFHKGFGWLL